MIRNLCVYLATFVIENKKQSLVIIFFTLSCFATSFANTFVNNPDSNKQPRFAPGIVSIIQEHSYLRTHNAPIYWKISPYYLPQLTDASCSLASATMVINALRIPQIRYANQPLATSDSVVHSTKSAWEYGVKQGGDGVTLDELGSFLSQALKAYNTPATKLEVIHATKAQDFATKFHQALLEGEKTGRTFIIVNFEQKFISGTELVGHMAPVGAYNAKTKRVLIMDPDRVFFEPYWISEQKLLDSMNTADSMTKKNRGFVLLTLK